MVELLDALVDLLRSATEEPLKSAQVEKYFRLDYPRNATVWVMPAAWPEQGLGVGGVTASPVTVRIVALMPCRETSIETDGDTLCRLAEQCRQIVTENREIIAGSGRWQRGQVTSCDFAFVEEADNQALLMARISASYTRVSG